MTYRRSISTEIQTALAATVLRDNTLRNHNPKYHRFGLIDLDVNGLPHQMEFKVFQQRPYSTAFIQMNGLVWAIGNSKCIGVHNGQKPDAWDAEEGMRLAIARAASDIGDQVQADIGDQAQDVPVLKEELDPLVTEMLNAVTVADLEHLKTYQLSSGYIVIQVLELEDEKEQEALMRFMSGQTMPLIDGYGSLVYLHDYQNFLAKGQLFWD